MPNTSTEENSQKVPNVRITEDDEAIFLHVYRRRLISSDSIYALFPTRSQEKLGKRLKLLAKARYLWRMELPGTVFRRREGRGSDHRVIAMDYRGARYLNQKFGVKIQTEKWRTRNENLAFKNIPHTLGVTGFMVSLELAARQYQTTSLIEFDELLKSAPQRTQNLPQPERFRTELRWKNEPRKEGIAPDAVFAIRNAESSLGDRTMYYMLEIDRDNETIVPGAKVRNSESFFRQSSIFRKFLVYTYAKQNGIAKKWFGFDKAFRVLFVTGSGARKGNMQAAFRNHMMSSPIDAKAGMNLFADRATLAQYAGDVLAMPWQDEIGREFYIDDRKIA